MTNHRKFRFMSIYHNSNTPVLQYSMILLNFMTVVFFIVIKWFCG
jgi:hypothetical protein